MWECDFWRWSPQSSVMISRRQLFDFACGHSGVTKVKDDDVVMFIEACLWVEASEADRGRYRRCSLPFSSKLRRKSDGSCSILATFYSDIARAERKISCAGAVRNRAAHSQVRPESGFTKFRFQAMTQYPEKSDQCMACQIRYGVRAIWHPIGWIFRMFFQASYHRTWNWWNRTQLSTSRGFSRNQALWHSGRQ